MDYKSIVTKHIQDGVLKSEYNYLFREPLTGFSSAANPLYKEIKTHAGDQHIYPKEILPGVKTVISFFVPFSKLVIDTNRNGEAVAKEYALSYIHCNKLINKISEGLIDFFHNNNINAEMVRATHTYDSITLKASWSHRSAAFIAGLGRFGLNRLLITPKGCAGRFGTVFISEEIEFDEPILEEQCLYYKNGSCGFCIKNCPTGALTENGIDRHKCNNHLLNVDKSFPELETCDVCGKCLVGPCAYIESD